MVFSGKSLIYDTKKVFLVIYILRVSRIPLCAVPPKSNYTMTTIEP